VKTITRRISFARTRRKALREARSCAALAELSDELAECVISRFAEANFARINNKAGFLMGIIRRVREDGPDGGGADLKILPRSVEHAIRGLMDEARAQGWGLNMGSRVRVRVRVHVGGKQFMCAAATGSPVRTSQFCHAVMRVYMVMLTLSSSGAHIVSTPITCSRCADLLEQHCVPNPRPSVS